MARRKKEVIPPELRAKVLKRDNYTCRYCGSTQEPLHCDHVYPESRGGETSYNNLVTACRPCNLKKHAKVGIWPHDPRVAVKIHDYETRKEHNTRLGLNIGLIANIVAVAGVGLMAYSTNFDSLLHLAILSAGAGVMWMGIAAHVAVLWYEKKMK